MAGPRSHRALIVRLRCLACLSELSQGCSRWQLRQRELGDSVLEELPWVSGWGGAGPLDVLLVSLSHAASPTRGPHPPGSPCGGLSKAGSTQTPIPGG